MQAGLSPEETQHKMPLDKSAQDQPDSNWVTVKECGPFTDHIGGIYERTGTLDPNEPVRIGFRVQPHHCNPSGACHGGMLASILDIAMGRGGMVARSGDRDTPTISLSIDYLAPAMMGDWIESRVQLLLGSRRLNFMQCILVGPHGPVLRGSGTFKIGTSASTGKPASI